MSLPPNLAQTMRAELEGIMPMLGSQELCVLRWLAVRLLQGQHQYGKLDVENDGRNFEAERAEELCDALIYSAIASLKSFLSKG